MSKRGQRSGSKGGSVTIRAAYIGAGGVVAATVLAWALGWIGPGDESPAGQRASATGGGAAVNVSGSGNEVSVGGTKLEVSAVWTYAERRKLSLALNAIEEAVESHRWDDLSQFMKPERVSKLLADGVEMPQLIEENVLGLGYVHNNLNDPDGKLEGYERLDQITELEIRGIDSSRRGVAAMTGSVTLVDGSRRDISFELELINGGFFVVLVDG